MTRSRRYSVLHSMASLARASRVAAALKWSALLAANRLFLHLLATTRGHPGSALQNQGQGYLSHTSNGTGARPAHDSVPS
jgi:hypothetical protein